MFFEIDKKPSPHQRCLSKYNMVKSLLVTLLFVCFISPTSKSSLKDPAKSKTGPPEKSAGVTKPDTKSRGASDHQGEIFSLITLTVFSWAIAKN